VGLPPRRRARYVRAPIPLPLREPSEVVEALFADAGERERAVYVSHVTSTTGLVLPLREIVAREARRDLCDLLGSEPLAPDLMVAQMATVRLPPASPELSQRLFTRHRVEIPVGGPEKDLLRLSVAGYTTGDEINRLLAALVRELDA
jgi:selenocysteine lyase/cysteine desulfurase